MNIRHLALPGLLALVLTVPVAAQDKIILGPQEFALDQPRVAVEVYTQNPDGSFTSFGPEMFNTFLLDTGASGVLAAGLATDELIAKGYQTVAVYDEAGVAGTSPMDVSASYFVDFAGNSGQRNTLTDIRLMSNPSLDLGGFNGIMGMPAMVNRVTTVDLYKTWNDPINGSLYVETDFTSQVPAGSGHRYHVPLTLQDFPYTGQRNPDDPVPTFAPLPFAPVRVTNGDKQVQGNFLVDTGAQLSIISSRVAIDLGLDTNSDGIFDENDTTFAGTLPVGGIGGTVEAPVLETAAQLGIMTQENVDLTLTDLGVLVLDIDESIDGIVGMDMLTSGWTAKVFSSDPSLPNGQIYQVHFDFTDAANMSGQMILDINPSLDNVIPEPTTMALIGIGAAGMALRREVSR